MTTRSGQVSWPGADGYVQGCTYTLSHGSTPGQATLTLLPGCTPSATGTLVISDGVESLTLRDCKVFATATAGSSSSGFDQILTISDRRWKWAFPTISGRYNVRDAQGRVIEHTEASPDTLARKCLTAMGERNIRIEGLPSNARPAVDWDVTNAAQALQELVEPLGCRLVYRPDQDAAWIVPLGSGRDLPDGSLAADNTSIRVPDGPDAIAIVGAPIRYQCRLMLEAVGQEFSGTIMPLDNLSYKPDLDDGWAKSNPPMFANLPSGSTLPGRHTHAEAIALARQSVWRYYRVWVPARGIKIPGRTQKITRRDQIILLGVQTLTDADDAGNPIPQTPDVIGSVYLGGTADNHSGEFDLVKVPFSVDQDRGLVIFEQPVYAIEGDSVVEPKIWVDTAFWIRDEITGGLERYVQVFPLGTRYGTQPLAVIRQDLQYDIRAEYRASDGGVAEVVKNAKQVEAMARYYFVGEAAKYQLAAAKTREWNGIRSVFPDGAIQQVDWSVQTGAGCSTRASLNTEHDVLIPPYPVRRKAEATGLLLERTRLEMRQRQRQTQAAPGVGVD